jgi:zinc transporter ZupT
MMDSLSKGVEHGHHHECDKEHGLHVSPIALMIGIGLHSFFEGMPFASEVSGHHHELQNSLLIGIIIHNIPLSIVLMSLFLNAGYSVKKSYILIVVIALAAPLGNLVSYLAGHHLVSNFEQYYQIILAIVVGIFFHISATILFESGSNHKLKLINWFIIALGISLALVTKIIH